MRSAYLVTIARYSSTPETSVNEKILVSEVLKFEPGTHRVTHSSYIAPQCTAVMEVMATNRHRFLL